MYFMARKHAYEEGERRDQEAVWRKTNTKPNYLKQFHDDNFAKKGYFVIKRSLYSLHSGIKAFNWSHKGSWQHVKSAYLIKLFWIACCLLCPIFFCAVVLSPIFPLLYWLSELPYGMFRPNICSSYGTYLRCHFLIRFL